MSADRGSRQAFVSRRHLLTAAAGAGATVAAVYVAGTAAGPVAATSTPSASGAADGGGSVVVHLRDLAGGVMDVFSGTQRIQVRDRDLAARIARAAAPDPTDKSL